MTNRNKKLGTLKETCDKNPPYIARNSWNGHYVMKLEKDLFGGRIIKDAWLNTKTGRKSYKRLRQNDFSARDWIVVGVSEIPFLNKDKPFDPAKEGTKKTVFEFMSMINHQKRRQKIADEIMQELRYKDILKAFSGTADLFEGIRKPFADEPEKGKFIVFEGIEASGKSTQANLLADKLKAEGKQVLLTREPGGTPLGEDLRKIVLNKDMTPKAELLLMVAARIEHWETVIKPALDRGEWVICDRFIHSTLAYQGAGRGLELDFIKTLHKSLDASMVPDITILMKIPLEESWKRMSKRTSTDKMEQESLEFFAKATNYFSSIRPENFTKDLVYMNGLADVTSLHHSIYEEVQMAFHK